MCGELSDLLNVHGIELDLQLTGHGSWIQILKLHHCHFALETTVVHGIAVHFQSHLNTSGAKLDFFTEFPVEVS